MGEADRNLGVAESLPPGYALRALVVVSVAAGVVTRWADGGNASALKDVGGGE